MTSIFQFPPFNIDQLVTKSHRTSLWRICLKSSRNLSILKHWINTGHDLWHRYWKSFLIQCYCECAEMLMNGNVWKWARATKTRSLGIRWYCGPKHTLFSIMDFFICLTLYIMLCSGSEFTLDKLIFGILLISKQTWVRMVQYFYNTLQNVWILFGKRHCYQPGSPASGVISFPHY